MQTAADVKHDSNRLTIAIFIVATTLTLMTIELPISPTVVATLAIPVGGFIFGLIVTAILAFLYILAKGYELRHNKKRAGPIDKYNYILYNLAMTAYALVTVAILLSYIYIQLNEASKAGNHLATAGVVVMFVGAVWFFNKRSIAELVREIRTVLEKKHKTREDRSSKRLPK